jgi:hypothetical protein
MQRRVTWESVYEIKQLGGHADFYALFFFGVTRFHGGSDKETTLNCFAHLAKSATEPLAMIRQAFGEESTSHTRRVQTHRDRQRRDRREQDREHAHNLL